MTAPPCDSTTVQTEQLTICPSTPRGMPFQRRMMTRTGARRGLSCCQSLLLSRLCMTSVHDKAAFNRALSPAEVVFQTSWVLSLDSYSPQVLLLGDGAGSEWDFEW